MNYLGSPHGQWLIETDDNSNELEVNEFPL